MAGNCTLNGPGLTQTASFGSQPFCSWPPHAIRIRTSRKNYTACQSASNVYPIVNLCGWSVGGIQSSVRVDRRRIDLLLRESSSAHLQNEEAFLFTSVIGYSNAGADPRPPATQVGDFVGKMFQPGVLGRPLALCRQSIRDIASFLKLQCPRKRRKKKAREAWHRSGGLRNGSESTVFTGQYDTARTGRSR
jgi:hypothetical protein